MKNNNTAAIAVNSGAQQKCSTELYSQPDLFGAEGYREADSYLDSKAWGFFSIVSKDNGKINQTSYTLNRLPSVLNTISKQQSPHDTWISQASFKKRNRRAVNLKNIGVLFVDLDYYKVFEDKSVESMVWLVQDLCKEEGIPYPSMMISSGKGLQLKWFHTKLPARALPRWHAVEDVLIKKFESLGADTGVRDVSRILRIPGTKNSKNGATVKVVDINTWRSEDETPVQYDFNELADELLPFSQEEIREFRQQRQERKAEYERQKQQLQLIRGGKKDSNTAGLAAFKPRQLAWDRYMDIMKLAEIRFGGNVPEGQRDTFLFWAVNFAALNLWGRVDKFWYEAYEIAKELTPSLSRTEIHGALSTVYAKVKQMATGQWVEFNGRKYPPLYTPKNATLIDWFEITEDEQRQLKTIISTDMAAERHRARDTARRRAAGAIPRAEYEARAAKLASDVKALKAEGYKQVEIAAKLGVSKSWVSTILKSS